MSQRDKQSHRSDEEVLKELCIANGAPYENIAKEGSDILALEMFFCGFPRMVGLSFFPKLRLLTIVGQDIAKIEALESCPLLQELWVVECHLTGISGLQNCLQLRKLYLYNNHICEIENLELLIKLEVLWLNSNRISQIQGLDKLQNLKELNLADNSIEKIGHSLEPDARLQTLNLSGNKIRSIKELTVLACLPQLSELTLNDPTTAPNPVCLLCNYATHVLYHMPRLRRLDTHDVSSKQAKEAAESIVRKKIMYYNMRVRMAQRKLADTRLSLMEKKKSLSHLPEESVRKVHYSLKNLERELSKVSGASQRPVRMVEERLTSLAGDSVHRSRPNVNKTCDSTVEQKILNKIEALKDRLAFWTKRLDEIETWFEQNLVQATDMMDYTIQFLLMELQSVGNIRLEEGCSNDPWFTPCCDLLLSRFCQSDFMVHHITGIKINRVLRIHNRALRLRFEDTLHSLLASSESLSKNYRHQLEHLFYVADPENNQKEEIVSIVEDGFKTADQYKVWETEGAIPFSNSLIVTEQPRIERALSRACKADSEGGTTINTIRHSQIIVAKVFVGHSMIVHDGKPVGRSHYPEVHAVYQNVETKHSAAVNEEGPHSPTTRSGPECSPRPRQWFVFDHELVLPEYIVYFEYLSGDQKQPDLLGQSRVHDDAPSKDEDALNMEPVLKPEPKLLSLDAKTILNLTRASAVSQITVLNLLGNSLSKMKGISSLRALQHLTVSFNEFTRLDDICRMPSLEFLDASYNHIVTLKGVVGVGQLKQLDMCWNQLTNAREDAAVLRKQAPSLLKLDTRYNPWKRPKTVRMAILGSIRTLTHLDDIMVAEEEAARAVEMATSSKITQAALLAHSCTNSDHPRSLSLLSTAQLQCLLNPAPWDLSRELELDWAVKITALNFDGQRISKLVGLNELVNLRWASFNDNGICKIEGLDSCSKLEELSLNNNSIGTLSGLSKLRSLRKLSLDGNQLSGLDASVLDQLSLLSFLSVENNRISSVNGIQRACSLLELYIGNNCISTSKDIYYVKGLTNLIILDLCGNPLLEKLENYRTYVAFLLPTLKALDGVAVEVAECDSAKEMFGGRLTIDLLMEKLSHSNYADIPSLTLQSCSIRTVDLSPPDLFCNLHTVKLDHNNLTSFSGLIDLPNIKTLSLNYNRIESILPRQKTQTHLTNRQMLHSKVQSSGYGQQRLLKGKGETGHVYCLEPLMGSLEVLHLSHNGIINMANLELSRLTNLKALFLEDNNIRQVDGLEGLHQLRELVLDKNHIRALADNSFISQNALLELHLAQNRIQDLSHLEPLTELCKLFLCMNKLQDIAEFNKLKVLPSLSELSVVGNPVARKSLHRPTVVLHLSQLQVLDGEIVTQEERTRTELLTTDELLNPIFECSGPYLLTTEISIRGVQSVVPQHTALRDKVGGLQDIRHGRSLPPNNVEETQSHHTGKSLKPPHEKRVVIITYPSHSTEGRLADARSLKM